jgi:hypothetical protein
MSRYTTSSGSTRMRQCSQWVLQDLWVVAVVVVLTAAPLPGFAQTAPLTLVPGTGRVGIGVSTPAFTLDVNGTVNASAFIGNGSQLTNLPNNSQWITNGLNLYYSAGNVGIGTTNPGYAVDVTKAGPSVRLFNINSNGNAANLIIGGNSAASSDRTGSLFFYDCSGDYIGYKAYGLHLNIGNHCCPN